MRSLAGALAGTLSRIRNASPVPLAPTYNGRSGTHLFNTLGSTQWDHDKLIDSYGSVGTLFAVVNRLANATSSVEWKLWRKAPSGLKEDRREVTAHAALDLWRKPNPFMPGQEFRETFQQHVDLTGESSWIVGRTGSSVPLELWPVRPDRIYPVPDPQEFLKGYIYRGPEGQHIPLELNEVIQLRMPNPGDPYRGLGPVRSILTDLDSIRYSAEWNKNFFLNSAEPGGIIEVENHLDDVEFDEMRARWSEQHKGVSKAHRVALLENGAKWIDRKYTMRDMQFVELSKISDDKIREAFGFPKAMQGIVEDVNRANAEAGEYLFSRWLLVPRLDRIKGALNHDLLPMFPSAAGMEFDYESPVAENSETENAALTARSAAAVALVGAGFDAAQVLEAVNLPAMAYEKPEPKVIAPPGQEDPAKDDNDPAAYGGAPRNAPVLLSDNDVEELREILAAQKWHAVEVMDDDSTCEPCRKVHGKTYKNRAAAYEDYPGGKGYKNCVGAEFGNQCRGKVVKRKASDDDD